MIYILVYTIGWFIHTSPVYINRALFGINMLSSNYLVVLYINKTWVCNNIFLISLRI